ncbi:MAG: discoidin domain-containing protein [Bacteroidales bacterium]
MHIFIKSTPIMIKINSLYILILVLLASCSTGDNTKLNPGPKPDPDPVEIGNEWKDNPYKLNVVYFVPNDMTPVESYKLRIERILFDAQDFFANNLEREGFGRASFGLDLDNDEKLNIITIKGKQGKSAYPYSGGGAIVVKELSEYFDKYPQEKKSEHSLVIIPSTSGNPLEPGGVPFYGYGRYCFALDYEHLDSKYLGQDSNLGNLATKWIGGLIHELGHGLNAPHNREWKSLQSTLGTALMGAGNGTYGKKPTFITAAHASVFANSQTFSTDVRSDWYAKKSVEITKLTGRVDNNKILIAGNFISDGRVVAINAWHDPHPAGAANQDYDAPSFTSAPVGQDSIYIECPLSSFFTTDGQYQLRIGFVHENGSRVTKSYEYEFVNNVPNIDVINTKETIDRTKWTLISADSEEDNGPVSNLIDGNTSSVWHTQWKSKLPDHPHEFVLDMGGATTIKGFAFENRSALNGVIKDFEMFKSDDGKNWTSLGRYTLEQMQSVQYVDLKSQQVFRYMKLMTKKSHGDFKYTQLAEIYAY